MALTTRRPGFILAKFRENMENEVPAHLEGRNEPSRPGYNDSALYRAMRLWRWRSIESDIRIEIPNGFECTLKDLE
jgi:hypothetical protein